MRGYTFRMKLLFWLLVIAAGAGLALWWRSWQRRHAERSRAAEERAASFMAQARAAAPAADPAQKLLFEAAGKAAEANEPALAAELYARLIARFPQGALAAQARAAFELQKRKLTS
jgi:TolA-binding protein